MRPVRASVEFDGPMGFGVHVAIETRLTTSAVVADPGGFVDHCYPAVAAVAS